MTNNGAAEAPADEPARSPLLIADLLANGQGVGRTGNLVTFVTGALPGETVRVAVDSVKANYISAHAVDILEPSADRVQPGCSVFPRCGGCQTLHLRYQAQLEWKRKMVSDALGRLGGLGGVDVEPAVASPLMDGTRYRNKVSLVPKRSSAHGEIGFYEARSHRVVGIERCPVVLPWLDQAIGALASMASTDAAWLGGMRHIVIRSGAVRKTLVVVLCADRHRPERARVAEIVRARIPGLTGVVESFDPAGPNAIFGRRFATLWGSPQTIERVGATTFHFGPSSFFQINTAMLERIAERLLATLGGAERVVDLYSGVGTFAVMLGRRGQAVTGVESSRAAVEEAAINAAINGVTSAAFECRPVVEAVSGDRGTTLLAGAAAVIVDPPRKGCEPETLNALAGRRVPRVEYLSCNPATLARDARILVDLGYRVRTVTPFDMFPFTGHVETLAEFVLDA